VADQESLVDEGWKRSFLELVGKPVIVLDRFIPRTRLRAIRQMMKLLRTGHVLGVFPEGRLGPGEDELYPFHVGPFMVAKKLEVPVLPMYISGTFKLALRKPVHINIGEPTSCGEDENYRDFARRLALTLNDLRPPYPGKGPFPNTWNWLTDLFLSEPRRPDPGYRALIIPEGGSAWKDTSDSAH
jgi:1-acyl-sn-glycerol-3-phosphate acyltransferase